MEKIICGDSLIELGKIADESVDLLCTDPPYGYGFMSKDWDKTLPNIGIFKECFRVLKSGAFAFVMSAPRSDVCARMMLLLEDAGFNIGFTPIYWTYASGFPKAMNIGKATDARIKTGKSNPSAVHRSEMSNATTTKAQKAMPNNGILGEMKTMERATWGERETQQAKALEGSYGGFQPKPAVEVVIVAMKPLSEKTFVDQALKNKKGITWLDDCRIPIEGFYAGEGGRGNHGRGEGYGFRPINKLKGWSGHGQLKQPEYEQKMTSQGRFPANLLVSDDVLNDGRISKSIPHAHKHNIKQEKIYGGGKGLGIEYGESVFDDSGSYSRYFSLDSWSKTFPFLIVPKASKREKNEGLSHLPVKQTKGGGGMNDPHLGSAYGSIKAPANNFHPTVKPITLMSYLITLGSRPNDVVLDPFLGSGTTALAAKQLGRKYISIEREKEYVEIAEARLKEIQSSLF